MLIASCYYSHILDAINKLVEMVYILQTKVLSCWSECCQLTVRLDIYINVSNVSLSDSQFKPWIYYQFFSCFAFGSHMRMMILWHTFICYALHLMFYQSNNWMRNTILNNIIYGAILLLFITCLYYKFVFWFYDSFWCQVILIYQQPNYVRLC